MLNVLCFIETSPELHPELRTLQRLSKMSKNEHHISKGLRSTLLGVVVNTLLAVLKIISGMVGNSYALIADGIESATDILGSAVVLTGIKIATKPPDEDHPYGHGKAEPLAAMAVSLMLLGAALGMAIQSIREIVTPHHAPEPFTLFVLVGVIFAKELLFRFVITVGENLESTAVKTDAWHHRSDAITSAAAFVGISIALLAGDGYESADDWAALIACGIIAYNGIRLLRVGLAEVMDEQPSLQYQENVRQLARSVPGVVDIEKCRIRKSGFDFFVEIHVEVEPEISVYAGHEIARAVKVALAESNLGILDTIVHIEPCTL